MCLCKYSHILILGIIYTANMKKEIYLSYSNIYDIQILMPLVALSASGQFMTIFLGIKLKISTGQKGHNLS